MSLHILLFRWVKSTRCFNIKQKNGGNGINRISLILFSKSTINLIINNCDQLKALSDLQSWTAIEPSDLSQFRQFIRNSNLELDTRSHQKLRKYLDLRDFERRTYMNLVTGPALERLRIAERQHRL